MKNQPTKTNKSCLGSKLLGSGLARRSIRIILHAGQDKPYESYRKQITGKPAEAPRSWGCCQQTRAEGPSDGGGTRTQDLGRVKGLQGMAAHGAEGPICTHIQIYKYIERESALYIYIHMYILFIIIYMCLYLHIIYIRIYREMI